MGTWAAGGYGRSMESPGTGRTSWIRTHERLDGAGLLGGDKKQTWHGSEVVRACGNQQAQGWR